MGSVIECRGWTAKHDFEHTSSGQASKMWMIMVLQGDIRESSWWYFADEHAAKLAATMMGRPLYTPVTTEPDVDGECLFVRKKVLL